MNNLSLCHVNFTLSVFLADSTGNSERIGLACHIHRCNLSFQHSARHMVDGQ